MNKIKTRFIVIISFLFTSIIFSQNYELKSPNGLIKMIINLTDTLSYSLYYKDVPQINPSSVGINFVGGNSIGILPRLKRNKTGKVNQEVTPLYGNNKVIHEVFNYIKMYFHNEYMLEIRAYDSGVALRFFTSFKEDKKVQKDIFDVNFSGNYKTFVSHPINNNFLNSYEENYKETKLNKLSDSLIMLPFLVESKNAKMVITESDLYDYPAMYFIKAKKNNSLIAVQPKYPLLTKVGGHNNFNLIVEKRADYIAKVSGKRSFPWKVIIVEEDDKNLLSNDLVYLLNREQNKKSDFSWVKPGKVMWDWWNDNNLKGVPFKSGINTETYKYFVDFAALHQIEYINLDEGWSDQYDLSNYIDFNPDLDVKEVISYANSKNVGVFLWCIAYVLESDMENVMKRVASWGVKGLKIDFMDRDDQLMVEFYEKVAIEASKNKLMINFHGAYKPTGMNREYPNIISHEAVRGLEYNKFEAPDGTTSEHALRIPFIRGVAGYMDYTPGAMTNAQKEDFGIFYSRPMSHGTRSQQLAMYIIFESSLMMLADSPSKYKMETEAIDFISKVPTTWDITIPLMGKVSDYAVMAKKSGDNWWVAGMTDLKARELEIDFKFLEDGDFNATIIYDGINADRLGEDFILENRIINKYSKISFKLVSGGGFVLQLIKKQ